MKNLLLIFLLFSITSCGQTRKPEKKVDRTPGIELKGDWATAYFASGCFWCVEAIYESIDGVKAAVSGYSGGHTENPSYREVVRGNTGHAETVMVIYDPKKVKYAKLVDVFLGTQYLTQGNGQGPDLGPQYRSIAFYQNEKEKQIVEGKIAELQKKYEAPIAVEVEAFEKFWIAESYHQNYEENHPNAPYIENVSVPRFIRFKKQFPELVKENKEK